MERKEIIKKLKDAAGFVHIADAGGYGPWGGLCYVSDGGISYYGTISDYLAVPCNIYTEEEFNKVKTGLEDDESDIDIDSFDSELVAMVKAGLKPGVQYWQVGYASEFDAEDDFFESEMEAVNAFFEYACGEEFTSWDEMDTGELEEWLDIARKRPKDKKWWET